MIHLVLFHQAPQPQPSMKIGLSIQSIPPPKAVYILYLSQIHFDENLATHGSLFCLRDMKLLTERVQSIPYS